MHTRGSWSYHRCLLCGKMVFSKAQDGYNAPCNCVKLHKKPRKAELNFRDPDSYFIDYDPIPYLEGGFKKNAMITKIQAECMLGVGTFSEGTILRDRNNIHYQVNRDIEGKQRIIRL